MQQADSLFMLPSDSAALTDLQAAGIGFYRLIPALNALVALQEAPDANGARDASLELHTNADAEGNADTDTDTDTNADGETESSAQPALEKPAMLFACNATRAAWLRGQGRLIRPA